jgi:general secretion pathway protein H
VVKARGFTLIEILFVIAIVATLVGTVAINLTGRDRERNLQTEAQRLALLIELARDEAQLQNQELGLRIDGDRYHFLRYNDRESAWEAIEYPPFTPRQVEPFDLSLLVEQPAALRSRQGRDQERQERREDNPFTGGNGLPQIFFFSSGEQTAFDISVLAPESWGLTAWQVSSDGLSRTRAERPES